MQVKIQLHFTKYMLPQSDNYVAIIVNVISKK